MLAREEKKKVGSRTLPVIVSEGEAADGEYLRAFVSGGYSVAHADPQLQYTASGTEPETRSYTVLEGLVPFARRVLVRNFFSCDVAGKVIRTNAENFKAIVRRAYCEMCAEGTPLLLVCEEEERVPQCLGTITWRFQSHGYGLVSVNMEDLYSEAL